MNRTKRRRFFRFFLLAILFRFSPHLSLLSPHIPLIHIIFVMFAYFSANLLSLTLLSSSCSNLVFLLFRRPYNLTQCYHSNISLTVCCCIQHASVCIVRRLHDLQCETFFCKLSFLAFRREGKLSMRLYIAYSVGGSEDNRRIISY